MQRIDLGPFEAFMQELAEVYDRKPYGAAAIKHWFEALSDFHWERVRHRLTLWRDSKSKPPMVSELLALLRESLSDDLERKAREDKEAFKREPTPVTPHGEACMAKIRFMLAHPRRPGRWWAYELRDMEHAGRVLNYTQRQMAMHACGRDWDTDRPFDASTQRERIPGEDDE